jgi:hypothetical protein
MPPGKMIGRRGNICDGSHIDGALCGKCYITDITLLVWMAGLEKVVVGECVIAVFRRYFQSSFLADIFSLTRFKTSK